MISNSERKLYWQGIRETRQNENKSVFSILLNAFSGIKKTAIVYRGFIEVLND